MSHSDLTKGVPWGAVFCYDPLPVGGIAVALLLGTYALLDLPPSVPLLVVGFCGTALVYGADRGLVFAPEDAVNHPERQRWVWGHRRWLLVEAGILLIAGGIALAHLRARTLLGAGLGGLLAGLHLVPIGDWGRPLKAAGLGKPLAVAGAWALGATVLPVLEAGGPVPLEIGGLAAYRFLFILPNVLLADWADRDGDVTVGLDPWTVMGTGTRLHWTATALLGGALGVGSALVAVVEDPLLLLVDSLGLAWMLGAVWGLDPKRPVQRLMMDLIVAWPVVTALTAWALG